ncbi:hypothetical protein Hanom_Chr07g00672701 [Helianthus anomalus]
MNCLDNFEFNFTRLGTFKFNYTWFYTFFERKSTLLLKFTPLVRLESSPF